MKRKRLLQELRGIALANGDSRLALDVLHAQVDTGEDLQISCLIWRCLGEDIARLSAGYSEMVGMLDSPKPKDARHSARYLSWLTELQGHCYAQMEAAAQRKVECKRAGKKR